MIPISLLACAIGLVSAGVAWILLRLIAFFTNLFYYGRLSVEPASPAANHLGWFAVLVPVAGALIIGLMARFGSDRIRGHGIPEALESILINGSKVQPRLAVLKPLSAAISIGSGGPFGAEGPIIMTGGAFGSLIAQFFHLTSVERKTLLVAGAAAGMSATFATPVAAVLLAVEVLLSEWKPRSAIPVALASATAGTARRYILGLGPLFPVPAHSGLTGSGGLSPAGLAGCVLAGLAAGLLSALLTTGVYAAEDGFGRLSRLKHPIHWMWWPALGAIVVGLGVLIFPQALGVGYDTIGALLQGNSAWTLIAGVLLVKSVIWIVALGSGTSGGVLAPLLMMGAALGGVEATFLPHMGAGFWPLVSMGATLAGTLGAPFTGVLFAFELTHDANVLLPLLVAAMLAHATTVLLLKRSILTEKVARRGFHISREYATDPLEVLFVRDVMQPFRVGSNVNGAVASPGESLRAVVFRMAESGSTSMAVIDPASGEPVGVVSLEDLLKARTRNREEEQLRERVFGFGGRPRIA